MASIRKAYKIRRESAAKILDILNSQDMFNKNRTIDLKYGTAHFRLTRYEIGSIGGKAKVPVDRLWKFN